MQPKIIVNVSDAKVANNFPAVLATFSLGSCIAVSLYDPSTYTGGMLHYQLPSSDMDPQKAKESPFMFADTGMKILLDKVVSLGANKKLIRTKIAGGASMSNGPSGFEIGKRNYLAIRKILWVNGMLLDAEDVGGTIPRNMYLDITDGRVTVKANGIEKQL